MSARTEKLARAKILIHFELGTLAIFPGKWAEVSYAVAISSSPSRMFTPKQSNTEFILNGRHVEPKSSLQWETGPFKVI